LGYGQITKFEKPVELSNDPIYADVNMDKYFKQGDSTTTDEGNGDAADFFNVPVPKDETPAEKINIESQIPGTLPDTGNTKKPGDKKPVQPMQKPADDKSKKTVKLKTANDY
jgi:hypothetical protein